MMSSQLVLPKSGEKIVISITNQLFLVFTIKREREGGGGLGFGGGWGFGLVLQQIIKVSVYKARMYKASIKSIG